MIPFYNGDEYIDSCLKSLDVGSGAGIKKIIVNNSDKPTGIHRIAASYKNVTVIDTEPRMGFGRACNEGAAAAILQGAEYVVFLNQDSIAGEDLVAKLIRPFKESLELVITAPIQYEYSFSAIQSWFSRWYASTCPDLFSDAMRQQIEPQCRLDCVNAACIAVRSSFIQAFGLFDPVYFMYWEDNDLCRKVRYLGYEIALIPEAKIAHCDQAGKGGEAAVWLRHSEAIFQMKDIKAPFIKTCLKICFRKIAYYIRSLLFTRDAHLKQLITEDIALVAELPRIARSRRAERDLVTRRHARGLQGNPA